MSTCIAIFLSASALHPRKKDDGQARAAPAPAHHPFFWGGARWLKSRGISPKTDDKI